MFVCMYNIIYIYVYIYIYRVYIYIYIYIYICTFSDDVQYLSIHYVFINILYIWYCAFAATTQTFCISPSAFAKESLQCGHPSVLVLRFCAILAPNTRIACKEPWFLIPHACVGCIGSQCVSSCMHTLCLYAENLDSMGPMQCVTYAGCNSIKPGELALFIQLCTYSYVCTILYIYIYICI